MPLELQGYTAHVCSDGRELEQFQVRQEDKRTLTCWIASESGKSFTVHWGDNSSSTLMQVKVLVDGRCVGRHAQFTDDEPLASSSSAAASELDKLGSIEVEMRNVQAYVQGTTHHYIGEVPEIGLVYEKSKKAGVHAVSIGTAMTRKPSLGKTPIGLQEEPFVVFKFLYRPLGLLRANDIAPRPPTGKKRPSDAHDTNPEGPAPSEPKRARGDAEEEREVKAEPSDGEDEDEDRAVFLQEQIMMLQNQLAQVQAKKPKTITKREPSPIRVPVDWTNEVIDLTWESSRVYRRDPHNAGPTFGAILFLRRCAVVHLAAGDRFAEDLWHAYSFVLYVETRYFTSVPYYTVK